MARPDEQGFSLIELVVVVAVLAILAAIGIPSFNAIIKQALLAITKTSLIDNYKQCKMNSDGEINLSNIPGVVFQSNDCASDITATINSECTLSMNMSTGVRTGWSDSYSSCVAATTIANSTSSSAGATNTTSNINSTQSSNSDSNSSKLISSPVAIKNDCNNGIETGLFINDNGDLQESWDHDCKFTDVNSVKESGTINLDSGSITLLDNGEIKLEGSYLSGINLNETQQEEINKGR